MKIVVIGSINTDLVITTNRMPKIGETVTGSGFSVNCGGKGANQAIASAKLGCDVSFVGAVGKDANGDISLKNLEDNNIDISSVETVPKNTGVAVITVCNGDNSIILDSGANDFVTKELIDRNINTIKNADAVVMQLEIPIDTVTYAAKLAREVGVKVILNPAPVKELPKELLENTDVIVLNESEAEFITGICPDSTEACQKCMEYLMGTGVKQAIITLGSDGCVYNNRDKIMHCPAVKTKVVDTTAAGDTFIGAFCVNLDKDITYAINYSAVASSVTVSRHGSSKSIPSKKEVDEILKKSK